MASNFLNVAEQYNKRNRNQFNYFLKKSIRKAATAVATEKSTQDVFRFNGLLKDPSVYYNVDAEFIVLKLGDLRLSNKLFNELSTRSASFDLMDYVLQLVPRTYEVDSHYYEEITQHSSKRVTFFVRFVASCYILIICNSVKKTCAVIHPATDTPPQEFHDRFVAAHSHWTKLDYNFHRVPIIDSGIYVVSHIF